MSRTDAILDAACLLLIVALMWAFMVVTPHDPVSPAWSLAAQGAP